MFRQNSTENAIYTENGGENAQENSKFEWKRDYDRNIANERKIFGLL